jgi:hypothetical protein
VTHSTPQSIAVAAAELLFANACMPGCDHALMTLPTSAGVDLWECRRWAGHENYGIDHQAADGTQW